jgi:hypothetical protein
MLIFLVHHHQIGKYSYRAKARQLIAAGVVFRESVC